MAKKSPASGSQISSAQTLLAKEIEYIQGDLFKDLPKEGEIMIPHVCNDIGAWGAGFVIPLGRTFPKSEQNYRGFFKNKRDSQSNEPFKLGVTQFVEAETKNDRIVWVANMIAQEGVQSRENPRPIVYEALESCIKQVAAHCDENTLIYAPKFGAGLAGGDWSKIEPMLIKHWLRKGLAVKVYFL